jgi:hypothetical protein
MYNYATERPGLFTEEGQKTFLKIRDNVKKLIEAAGAVSMIKAMSESGDGWFLMACVDRLVELGEIKELRYGPCAGQHRVFVSVNR